ncbi:DVUA0089 family protein [Desulfogranum japonicum]|uniref:DVUA0089 family protein n=1 Tax=Desulfogranum japonicum TaxID=231447 RepID=UPI0012946518|nr:DVUA0089 family protein [Desulfogranum japonicum]
MEIRSSVKTRNQQYKEQVINEINQDNVLAAIQDNRLTMSGSDSLTQLRTALFDNSSKMATFLGGPVNLRLTLPQSAKEFTLQLEARNTTGYKWEVLNSGTLRQKDNSTVRFKPRYQAYGSPSIQTFVFQPNSIDEQEIQLIYHRPFEKGSQFKSTLSLKVDAGMETVEISDPTPSTPEQRSSADLVDTKQHSYSELDTKKSLPSSWDWRTNGIVPPVRDQGSCGSCWSFGTVGIMESAVRKAGGPLTDLSEQFLINCNRDDWGCDGGWTANKYHYNVLGSNQNAAGAVMESILPYAAAKQSCNVSYPHPYKLNNWQFVTGSEQTMPTVTQIKNAIYTYGPVTAGVCVDNGWYSYTGGVYIPYYNACYGYTNHQIILVGWNDSTQSWILRNSWGPNWGVKGYMNIRWDSLGTTSRVGEGTSWVRHPTIGGTSQVSFSHITSLLLKNADTPSTGNSCLSTIAVGDSESDSWNATCFSTHRSGSYAKYFTFSVSSSTSVQIDLTSSIDTYLYLLNGEGKTGSVIESDDDGGTTGYNSQITRTLSAGTYTIEATTYSSSTAGPFTVSVQ